MKSPTASGTCAGALRSLSSNKTPADAIVRPSAFAGVMASSPIRRAKINTTIGVIATSSTERSEVV